MARVTDPKHHRILADAAVATGALPEPSYLDGVPKEYPGDWDPFGDGVTVDALNDGLGLAPPPPDGF